MIKGLCVCREILNEERCPGFLLEAVRSAIKKKRRVIKAKMLGSPVNDCSSRSVCHTLHSPFLPCPWRILGNIKSVIFTVMMKKGPLCPGPQKSTVQELMVQTNLLSHASEICELFLQHRL